MVWDLFECRPLLGALGVFPLNFAAVSKISYFTFWLVPMYSILSEFVDKRLILKICSYQKFDRERDFFVLKLVSKEFKLLKRFALI